MLSDITIVIPTFHRRGYLAECFRALKKNLPKCSVVVAQDDDGDCTLEHNTWWKKLPYDSGLTAKRNSAVRSVETKYTLIGCDDFDFSTKEARTSIDRMAVALDLNQRVDVVVGRHNEKHYEGFLEYVPGEYIREHRLNFKECAPIENTCPYLWKIDIGVNFFLARTEVLLEVPWDESIKPIGGEHADWFLDMKAANKLVAFLPYANINDQPYAHGKQSVDYPMLRRRAFTTGHELMKKKRNIRQYIDFNGGIS